jgi:hypothetical protein
MITIKITNGVFYNTLHPTATPSRVIRVGDIFEIDDVNLNGSAVYKAMYGSMLREVTLDSKYWDFVDDAGAKVESDGEVSVACTCDIMALMNVGCKCGWIEIERGDQ